MLMVLAPSFYRVETQIKKFLRLRNLPQVKAPVLKIKFKPSSLAPEVLFLTTALFIKQKTRSRTILKAENHTKNKALSLL